MMRGLVIGKFMPIHLGHAALIDFACRHCDEVIVSMSYTDGDPIAGAMRFEWVKATVALQPKARAFMVLDDFDDESLPLEERTRRWSAFIRRVYPEIGLVVSSEDYGEPFARHLGAAHLAFDPDRRMFPVSASLIRAQPMRYWDFIAGPAKPYFVKKICVYGPESTGKSTLTLKLAERYNTVAVPEVAREMLVSNTFTAADIMAIGIAHDARIREQAQRANRLLFCDTDAITTQLYSKHYLGVVPEILYELERRTSYAMYFLLDIDVPWIADGLRDLGDRREEMLRTFREALVERNIAFVEVRGDFATRERIMCEAIDILLARG